jgi:hypothetical protein
LPACICGNAYDLRELERVYEQDGQRWAKNMKNLLLEMNELTKENDGALTEDKAKPLMKRYRTLLTKGSNECSENVALASKKGRSSESKSRNLLNRLREYETEVSGHAFNEQVDALPISWRHVEVRVNERSDSAEDLHRLGFQPGDFVTFDSDPEISDYGYLSARHLDNKAGAAALLASLKSLQSLVRAMHLLMLQADCSNLPHV